MKIAEYEEAKKNCLTLEDSFTADATHFGQIDFRACEIIVNKDMTKEAQEEIITQEMVPGSSSWIIWNACR